MSARQKLEAQLTENNIVKEVRTQLHCIFHIRFLIYIMLIKCIHIYVYMFVIVL